MSLPLISVIVPIYNVEKYLNRCIESIINQTYINLEILLVNDGSTDKCPNICDEWKNIDKRIHVIHKENGGLSDARNAGMLHAKGDFIVFIDSDDWINSQFIALLYSTLINTKSDIVECGVTKVWEDNKVKINFDIEDNNYKKITKNTNDALYELIQDGLFHQHVWNKMYRRDVINNYLFKKGKIHEDEFWTYHIFANAKKITYIDLNLYYYFQRHTSIMGERFNIKRLDVLEAKKERQEFIDMYFPELSVIALKNYYWSCIYLQQLALKYSKNIDNRKIKSIIKSHYMAVGLKISDMNNLKEKIWLILMKKSFILTCYIRNLFHIGF